MSKIKVPSVKTVLFKSKSKSLKDYRQPVYLSVYYDGKRKYYSLSMNGRTNEWTTRTGRYKRSPEANTKIDKMELQARNAISELERLGIEFTHQKSW